MVAVKRMYFRADVKGKKKAVESVEESQTHYRIARYTFNDELKKTMVEANILYWATSLMSFTYSFIDSTIEAAKQPPEFNIPHLRFVKAGLAVSHEQRMTKEDGGPKAQFTKRAYLLEEFIDERQDHFTKYIYNGSAVPIIDHGDPDYELAQFLSFVQHVQYNKSGQMVYISDLQGKEHCCFMSQKCLISI